jgi:hypothetical protein
MAVVAHWVNTSSRLVAHVQVYCWASSLLAVGTNLDALYRRREKTTERKRVTEKGRERESSSNHSQQDAFESATFT